MGGNWVGSTLQYAGYPVRPCSGANADDARRRPRQIKGRLQSPKDSHEWATAKRGEIFGRAGTAIMNAIQTHVAEKDAEKA